MKKEFILYSIAIGVNRGASLLYLPLLTASLSLAEFGIYSYVQIFSQILFPILSLNISSGIAREGAEMPSKASTVYNRMLLPIIGIIITFSVTSFFVEFFLNIQYLLIIFLIAGLEALHNMQLSVYRAFDQHVRYLLYVISKTIGLGIIFGLFIFNDNISLLVILYSQIVWNLTIFLFFTFYSRKTLVLQAYTNFEIKPVIIFCLLLIPHVISQWAMSAVNRVIVKNILGNDAMGMYSISFSLSMITLLINSGIAIVLPQNFIRNPDYWLKVEVRRYFSFVYSLAVIFLYFCVILFLIVDKKYFGIMQINNFQILYCFAILTSSFMLLGYYYYYANILFYHKKSKLISTITFVTALFSLFFSYFLTLSFGLIGAAFSFLFTYIIYLLLAIIVSKKCEQRLKLKWDIDFLIPSVSILIIIISGYYFQTIF